VSEAVEESVLVSVTVLLADRVSLVVAVSVFVSVVALVSVRVSEAVEVSVTGKVWSVPPAVASGRKITPETLPYMVSLAKSNA
jgi:hypothetical protein